MAEKDKKDNKRDKPMTREEALENALKQIEKNHGKGAIMRLGEAKANMNIEVISTGILPLDIALGVGGILPPATGALLHNGSTLVTGLKSMTNLLDEEESA